ncbi:MAG: hypothetical protein JNK49_11530 [Planctomycetes bacterium]|nr:hypothetical protein [Planctomycetota bacterium]
MPMPLLGSATSRVLSALVALSLAGVARAQIIPPNATGGQGGWFPGPAETPVDSQRLDPRWSAPVSPIDVFGGAFGPGGFGALFGQPGAGPAGAPGAAAGMGQLFGAYPAEGGISPALLGLSALPPEPPDWPRNLIRRAVEPLPYVPTLALLVRFADRVWWRAPDEDAFVPLYFHDNVRGVPTGTAIEVRQTGEFELLLHGGGRLRAKGPTALQVLVLDEQRVELRLSIATHVQFAADVRAQTLRLPDGSAVEVRAADPKAEPADGPVVLRLDRVGDPLACSGRLELANLGLRPVVYRHAFGSTELAPGHRLQLFATPPAHELPAQWVVRDASAQVVDARLECSAKGDGEVHWSGAGFRLAPGATLRLEPLLGTPFATPAKPKSTAAEPAPNPAPNPAPPAPSLPQKRPN